MTLKATLDAGAPADFFERVMASPNEAPPQFANVNNAITQAAESDNPNLNKWAQTMNTALDNTAEGQALAIEQASAGPLGGMMDSFKNIISAIKTALSDGFQMDDIKTVMNAFNQSAENGAAQKFALADKGLEAANAHLIAAGADGNAIKANLGDDNGQVASVMNQIKAIPS